MKYGINLQNIEIYMIIIIINVSYKMLMVKNAFQLKKNNNSGNDQNHGH